MKKLAMAVYSPILRVILCSGIDVRDAHLVQGHQKWQKSIIEYFSKKKGQKG